MSDAQKQLYSDLGVESVELVCTLDSVTCPKCGALDGTVIKETEMRAGVTAPPFHPRCRCTTAPYYEDIVTVEKRAAREDLGSTYYVDSDVTYDEWKYVSSGKDLTSADYDDIVDLKGKVSDRASRQWYVWHCDGIPEQIDKTLPLEQQARQAFELRNLYKFQARELMVNQIERKDLDKNEEIKSFEEHLRGVMADRRCGQDEALRHIIESAPVTRQSVNERLGVEHREYAI